MGNYKSITKCPDDLREMIELINLLKYENIETLRYPIIQLLEMALLPELRNSFNLYKPKVREYFQSERLFNYLADSMTKMMSDDSKGSKLFGNGYRTQFTFPKFTNLLIGSEILRSVGERNQALIRMNEISLLKTTPFDLDLQTYKYDATDFFLGRLVSDEAGNLRPQFPEIINLFLENDISYYRIRICPVCDEVFWARRINSQSCGTKNCAPTLSLRLSRHEEEIIQFRNDLKEEESKFLRLRSNLGSNHALVSEKMEKIIEIYDELKKIYGNL